MFRVGDVHKKSQTYIMFYKSLQLGADWTFKPSHFFYISDIYICVQIPQRFWYKNWILCAHFDPVRVFTKYGRGIKMCPQKPELLAYISHCTTGQLCFLVYLDLFHFSYWNFHSVAPYQIFYPLDTGVNIVAMHQPFTKCHDRLQRLVL